MVKLDCAGTKLMEARIGFLPNLEMDVDDHIWYYVRGTVRDKIIDLTDIWEATFRRGGYD